MSDHPPKISMSLPNYELRLVLPTGLWSDLKLAAERGGRTMEDEALLRLQGCFPERDGDVPVFLALDALEEQLGTLRRSLWASDLAQQVDEERERMRRADEGKFQGWKLPPSEHDDVIEKVRRREERRRQPPGYDHPDDPDDRGDGKAF